MAMALFLVISYVATSPFSFASNSSVKFQWEFMKAAADNLKGKKDPLLIVINMF